MNREIKEKTTEALLRECESILGKEQTEIDKIIKELTKLPICKQVAEMQKLERQQEENTCPFGYVKPPVHKK